MKRQKQIKGELGLIRLLGVFVIAGMFLSPWAGQEQSKPGDFVGELGVSLFEEAKDAAWSGVEGWGSGFLEKDAVASNARDALRHHVDGGGDWSGYRALWRERLKSAAQSARTEMLRRGARKGIDTGIEHLQDWLTPGVKRLRTSYRVSVDEGDRGWWSVDALGALRDSEDGGDGNVFWQLSGRSGGGGGDYGDDRTTFNAGLGYRWLTDSKDWLLGVNVFYDRETSGGHSRLGGGGEAKSKLLDLYTNSYWGLSGTHRSGGWEEEVRDGFELGVAGRLPSLPWLETRLEHQWWNGTLGEDDEKGLSYGVTIKPIPLVRLEANTTRRRVGRIGMPSWCLNTGWECRFRSSLAVQRRRWHRRRSGCGNLCSESTKSGSLAGRLTTVSGRRDSFTRHCPAAWGWEWIRSQ